MGCRGSEVQILSPRPERNQLLGCEGSSRSDAAFSFAAHVRSRAFRITPALGQGGVRESAAETAWGRASPEQADEMSAPAHTGRSSRRAIPGR